MQTVVIVAVGVGAVFAVVLTVCAVIALRLVGRLVDQIAKGNASTFIELFRQFESDEMLAARENFHKWADDLASDSNAGRNVRGRGPFSESFVSVFTAFLQVKTDEQNHTAEQACALLLMRFYELAGFLQEQGYVSLDDCDSLFGAEILDHDQLTRPYFTGVLPDGDKIEDDERPRASVGYEFPHAWALADKIRARHPMWPAAGD